ncbi:MAG: anthranilate phosphoribosyltransferase [Marinifilaceae bacterium]
MKKILTRLINHEELSQAEATTALLNITSGNCNEAQIAALLTAYQMRMPSVSEILGFRDALLQTSVSIPLQGYNAIDIVGTGGDEKNTFNISTCAAFVVAGAGYKVAKHGNYASTSISGASNVLQEHGIVFTNNVDKLKQSIDNCGITYLHAPLFNPAMKQVASVRKELQLRTLFNLLGPLVNPSRPTYQLLGVANLSQMRLYANVLNHICTDYAVISSLDKYDEISLTGDFKVTTSKGQQIYSPSALNFSTIDAQELYGGDTPQEAATILRNVLGNCCTPAQRECVVANAAFAIHIVSGLSIDNAIDKAYHSLLSGQALSVFKKFITLNS